MKRFAPLLYHHPPSVAQFFDYFRVYSIYIFPLFNTHRKEKSSISKKITTPEKNEKTKAKFIITKPLSLIECYYTLLCKTKTINDMKIFFTIIRSKKSKKLSGKYLSNHIIVLWAINSRKMHYFEYIHYYLLHENLPIIKCTISPEYPPSIYYYSRPLLRKKALILFYYSKKQSFLSSGKKTTKFVLSR